MVVGSSTLEGWMIKWVWLGGGRVGGQTPKSTGGRVGEWTGGWVMGKWVDRQKEGQTRDKMTINQTDDRMDASMHG